MYGHRYSKQFISNITKTSEKHVKEFHNIHLNKQYVVVYMVDTILNIRRDSVSKEAVRILVGIKKVGYKEMLQSIQEHGCSEILFCR